MGCTASPNLVAQKGEDHQRLASPRIVTQQETGSESFVMAIIILQEVNGGTVSRIFITER